MATNPALSVALCAASDAHTFQHLRTLFTEYAVSLGSSPCLTGFDQEIRNLPGEYASPRGALLWATVDGNSAGCCALRPLDHSDHTNACEMKRLYVRPQFRGLGLGRQLAEVALETALHIGYSCVLLDTLDDMESARSLYEDLGFVPIAPYYFNPAPGAHYLKVDLTP
jgi:ribosomal protein S18 acetylase RimI-like enzyme